MRTPRFAEAPDQRRVVGFEEQQTRRNHAPMRLNMAGNRSSAAPSRMSTTSAARRALGVRVLGQFGELRHQVDGKIVHGE
jgi:hypothetical protein